jgi:DNA polymerase III subunit epsilon
MNLKRPIIFIDIEATGADPSRDRIIEIALIKMAPDRSMEERVHRFNPGMRIPSEVIAIHGITNELLENEPPFRDLAPALVEFIADCDFGGFGLARFDVPILIEEFRRCNIEFSAVNRALVDGLAIFHQREKRDLTAAYHFYCRKKLEGAHGARADALASLEVVLAQLDHYNDLPREVDALHLYCHKQDHRYVDSQRKFIWRDGEAAINFGKHKGILLRTLVSNQRDYVQWMASEGKFSQDVIDLCWKALQGEFPQNKKGTESHVS